jgi:uncharacterized protein with HEPN domain
MKEADDTLYLLHVQECIARLEKYTAGNPRRSLNSDLRRDAVLRVLQIMAESTQRLSNQLKAQLPKLDWQGMARFRNVLVHGYLKIDVNRVREIIAKDIPQLKQGLAPLFELLPKRPKPTKPKRRPPSRKKKRK